MWYLHPLPPLLLQVVNRGRTTVSFTALPSLEALQRCNIDLLPAAEVLLRPRESADLTFYYKWVETRLVEKYRTVRPFKPHVHFLIKANHATRILIIFFSIASDSLSLPPHPPLAGLRPACAPSTRSLSSMPAASTSP